MFIDPLTILQIWHLYFQDMYKSVNKFMIFTENKPKPKSKKQN